MHKAFTRQVVYALSKKVLVCFYFSFKGKPYREGRVLLSLEGHMEIY